MTVVEGEPLQVGDEAVSSAREAEDLFATLATDGRLASETAAALVTAMDFLGLKRSEAQVAVAIQEVAPATENQLTKSEFLRFFEWMRGQAPATDGSDTNAIFCWS